MILMLHILLCIVTYYIPPNTKQIGSIGNASYWHSGDVPFDYRSNEVFRDVSHFLLTSFGTELQIKSRSLPSAYFPKRYALIILHIYAI